MPQSLFYFPIEYLRASSVSIDKHRMSDTSQKCSVPGVAHMALTNGRKVEVAREKRVIPGPIRRYLDLYSVFDVDRDLKDSFVRTSAESFFYAVNFILQSLTAGEVVWSTDNLSLSSSNFFSNYWFDSGLPYLQADFEAAIRGVKVNRVFIVRLSEYKKYKVDIDLIAALQARAGVRAYLAIYEDLDTNARRDFVTFGDAFVDEVIYDIGGGVLDNKIHWGQTKCREYIRHTSHVRAHIKGELATDVLIEKDFNGVRSYANRLKESLQPLLEERSRGLDPTRRSASDPIKILLLAANPLDTTHLSLGAEFREIDRAVRQSEFRDSFRIEQQNAVRVLDLQDHLLRYRPDIVHFSGHGGISQELIFESSAGQSHPILPAALSKLFGALRDDIKCVVLNACYSEAQANAIAEHIECVVGMSKAISDLAAINYASSFYRALGYGRDLHTAHELGCVEIALHNLPEEATPKLICLHKDPKTIRLVRTAS